MKYDYATTQIKLPELNQSINDFISINIPESKIIELPEYPHVTILYGLTCDAKDVENRVKPFNKKIVFSLGKLNIFSQKDQDVLYITVLSDDLHQLHNLIKQLPNKSEFPEYKPHIAIAYLKKGSADKFLGRTPFAGVFVKNSIEFSSPENKVTNIKLDNTTNSLIITDVINKPRLLQA